MAAFAYEISSSRVINDEESPSAETVWQVIGATSYGDAATALAAVLPTTFTFPDSRVAWLNGVSAKELRDDEYYTFSVSYAAQPKPEVNETEYEFEISAQTERIFQSIATTAYAPAGKTAPNFGGAIGLADGSPSGVEPLTAFSTFSITKHWALSAVDETHQLVIEGLMGAVSSATFNGRAAGTVRFLGARGRRSGDKFPISYQFGFRPNVASFVIDAITVTTANGWDIIDTYYEWQADTSAKKAVRRARAVYVHRIHPLTSLAGLGL